MQNQRIRLEELTEVITKGTTPTTLGKDFAVNGIRFLRVQNLNDGKLLFSEDDLFIDQETDQLLKRSRIQSGDILLSIAGTIGRSAIVPLDCSPLNCNQAVAILRPNKKVFAPYLRFWLDSLDAQKQMMGAKVTGTISNLSLTQIRNLEIALPPLAEQKRIARILDVAAAVQAQRRATLTHLDTLLQSTFLHLFGDPITNPMRWETRKLGALSTIRRGASPRPISNYLGGTVPWIKIGDGTKGNTIYIEDTEDKVTEEGASKSVYLNPGTLIVANSGVSLGFARILRVSGCIHDGWLALENLNESIEKVYLLKLINLLTNHLRRIAPSGTQPNLNTALMKNFDILLPPKPLQERFCLLVEQNEKVATKLAASVTQLDALFVSLQQRAFRGELSPG